MAKENETGSFQELAQSDWVAAQERFDPRDLPWRDGRWAVVDRLHELAETAIGQEEFAVAGQFRSWARVVARCDQDYFREMARIAIEGV